MRDRRRGADGFQVASGLLGIGFGPVLLLRGAPAGWSFLLLAAGIVLLSAQWMIVNDVEFRIPDQTEILLAALGIVCVGIAVIYLTRAADDLPRLFPGHDGDSEHFRTLPGLVTLTAGLGLLGRTLPSLRPGPTPG